MILLPAQQVPGMSLVYKFHHAARLTDIRQVPGRGRVVILAPI